MDTHGNILKLSFLMSYLALLICLVVGIPFMTCVFRAIILMCIFSVMGYSFRWFLLTVVSSVEPEPPKRTLVGHDEDMGEFDMSGDDYAGEPMEDYSDEAETVDQNNGLA